MKPDYPERDGLVSRAWRFEVDGWVISPFLSLLENGEIAGDPHPSAVRWVIEEEGLIFLDDIGRTSFKFHQAAATPDGRVVLTALVAGWQSYVLQEIENAGSLADPDPCLGLIRRTRGPRRRNLVVLRAGEGSLHHTWLRDVTDADRSWDLCLSIYGDAEMDLSDPVPELHVEQRDDRKYEALYKLFHAGSELLDYEYVVFPDDDLLMSYSDINQLFEVCRHHRLELAHPSQSGGFISYGVMHQRKEFTLRYVTLVESMMPVFSRDALRRCAPTFAYQRNGFGASFAWTKLLSGPPEKIAIVDVVSILHSRTFSINDAMWVEWAEGEAKVRRFGRGDPFAMQELGGIYAEPIQR